MAGIRVETRYKHVLCKSAARCVGKRSRTQVAWKDNKLDFVVRALILVNLNKKGCMNWEFGNHFRYFFNWVKPGKLINQENYFGDTCINIWQNKEYAGLLG
jgi:hypothetical protein